MRILGVSTSVLAALLAGPAGAAAPAEGRWDGTIAVPGAPQRLVLDLEPDAAGGWSGSVILPGRGVKGAPVHELVVEAGQVRFSLAAALPFAADKPPVVVLAPAGVGRLAGHIEFAGLSAVVEVSRQGPPQVDRPPRNQPVGPELGGRWVGSYELFGQPRQVTLTLDGEQAEMVIVGRRTTRVPFEQVRQGEHWLTLSGNEFGIDFEGRWRSGQIEGTFQQGPIERPLTLRRAETGG
jgi:hypothetical protein